jgi:hypothetical protein
VSKVPVSGDSNPLKSPSNFLIPISHRFCHISCGKWKKMTKMITKMITKQNKLGSYLAVTAGAGCVASVANGAVMVTHFVPETKTSIGTGNHEFTLGATPGKGYHLGASSLYAKMSSGNTGDSFSQGIDFGTSGKAGKVFPNFIPEYYYGEELPLNGAVVDGATLNFAELDLFGDDDVRESVVAFIFDGVGGGYIVAVATNDDNTALLISDGVAAGVPEPSGLTLLALGSLGLAARRQRRKAA